MTTSLPTRKTLPWLLLLAFPTLHGHPAPQAAGPPDEVDAFIRGEMAARRIPGAALAVVQGGRIVRVSCYGLASAELDVPVTPQTIFPIASLDKQLTATGIMLMVEDGTLGLGDPVSTFFDEAPREWQAITVRQLLSHTSGLPDAVADDVEGRSFTTYTTEQQLEHVRGLTLVAPPGTAFNYSDANFFLAQLITERVAGIPWRRVIAERVFAPAGMRTATFMDPAPIVKHRVAGYGLTRDGVLVNNRRLSSDWGPHYNDLATTVEDFAHWALALDTNAVLNAGSRDTMWTPAVLADGRRANEFSFYQHYGFGFGLARVRNHRVVLHTGSTGVAILKLPDHGTSVVVFTNLDHRFGSDPAGLALGVAGVYVPQVSLSGLAARPDPEPALTERLRAEFERFSRGAPDRASYLASEAAAAWMGSQDLAARGHLLGRLDSFVLVEEGTEDGERVRYYRAGFAGGRMFVRVGLTASGLISGLQWWRL
jgi:CubicO group peptidase (beta-lactamase class C family)